MISPGAARFYYDAELIDRESKIAAAIARRVHKRESGSWVPLLRWLNVVQAEINRRGLR